jgi:hypothetical protein
MAILLEHADVEGNFWISMSVIYNVLAVSITDLCLRHFDGSILTQFVRGQNLRVTSTDENGAHGV